MFGFRFTWPTGPRTSMGVVVAILTVTGVAVGGTPWPELSRPAPVDSEGSRDAALVVAIEDYLFVPKVAGARRNGTDWYAFLVDGRRIPVERVTILRDATATREAVLRHATLAGKSVAVGGTLWIVFIGHGAPAEDGGEGVLVGVDAQQSAEGLFARSIRQSELRRATGNVRTVSIIDACFSGRTSTGAALAPGLQPLLLTKSLAGGGGVVLSAGRHDEFAGPLPDAGRPAFSYLLLGALRGWGDADGDGIVTAREAIDYTRKTLSVLPIGRAQTPELAAGDGTTVLASGAREREPSRTRSAVATPEGPVARRAHEPSRSDAKAVALPDGPDRPPTLRPRGPAMVSLPGGTFRLGGAP